MLVDALAGSVLVLALTLWIELLWSRRISSRLRRTLSERLRPADGATFVGLHPGHGVRFTEGFPDWDFGFVTLEGDWLCYRGEKTRFAVARREIGRIEITSGPIAWLRERRVEVTCAAGAFTLSAEMAHTSKAKAGSMSSWLRDWAVGTFDDAPTGYSPEPAPALPKLPGIETTRAQGMLRTFGAGFKLLLAAALTAMLAWHWVPSSIILLAPLAGIVRMLPRALWPVRRPCSGLAA